jgi:hypothetical protein
MGYAEKLASLGLTELQITTMLCGWSCEGIEAVIRGEKSAPSDELLESAISRECEKWGCE